MKDKAKHTETLNTWRGRLTRTGEANQSGETIAAEGTEQRQEVYA